MRKLFKNKPILFSLLLMSGLWGNVLLAQSGDAGLQNPLHELGAGARALSLGRAYVALADDPTAVFWNPAGLESVQQTSFTLYRSTLGLSGVNYDFLGLVYPTLNLGSVGIGYARIGVGDILYTDEFNATDGSTFSYDYSELYIGYAKKVRWGMTPGITFKVHRQSVSLTGQDNSAFGLDAGLLYRPDFDEGVFSNVAVGFHYQNLIKPELNFSANKDSLASKLTIGLLKSLPVGLNGKMNILLSYSQIQNGSGTLHAGAEYAFSDMGNIRIGFDNNKPSFGAGAVYKFVNIDYAFGNLSEDNSLSAAHRFSVTFNFGKTRQEKIELAIRERIAREQELVENTKIQERQRRITEGMNRGKQLLESGKFFEASVEFQRVIQEDPFNTTAQSLFDSTQSIIEEQFRKRQEEAVDKQLAEQIQQQVKFYFERGRNYLQNKQYTDALIQFTQALELSPGDPVLTEAVNSTKRQLSQEIRTMVQEARQKFQQGNYSDALQILSEALLLSPDPDQPETKALRDEINTLTNRIRMQQYLIRGLALLRAEQYQEANTVFEEALKLDPTNETIRQYLDQTRLQLGAKREKMDEESEKQYAEAMDHFLAGRYEKALVIFKDLARKYPYNKKLQDAIEVVEDRIKRSGNQ
jgi:tetratricopeptide (TPR) repeat protein